VDRQLLNLEWILSSDGMPNGTRQKGKALGRRRQCQRVLLFRYIGIVDHSCLTLPALQKFFQGLAAFLSLLSKLWNLEPKHAHRYVPKALVFLLIADAMKLVLKLF